eukprot:1799812-Pyramimonas_sp.AAC.1
MVLPGYSWKLPPIEEAFQSLKLREIRMRLCNFGIKFNSANERPSGPHLHACTPCLEMPTTFWRCKRTSVKEHQLD